MSAIEEMTRVIQLLDSDISPSRAFTEMTADILKDIHSGEELTYYFLLISRSISAEYALPQMAEFKKSDLSLFENAAKLIERGQRLGEFKQGDPYKLSLLFFSVIQGMANMKLFMGEKYIAPEVQDIMVLLLK